MSDLMIKPVTPPPVASPGLSALAPARSPMSLPGSATPQVDVDKKETKTEESANLLEKAAANIQKYMPKSPAGTQLRIEKDQTTNIYVYQTINSKSGEVVSQYPSEEIMRFISYYREKEGMAVDKSA